MMDGEPVVNDEANAVPMSYAEMRQLSLGVNQLSEEQVRKVLQIIEEHESIRFDPDGFEIDFETYKTTILRALEVFVADCPNNCTEAIPNAASPALPPGQLP
ncbi:hypothetical protein PMAYCL1PPCAC_10258, partial [Pristionchus mayeri]